MKPTYRIIVVIAVIAVLTFVYSCSKPAYIAKTENLSTTGYSNYKTYAFLPTTDTAYTKMFDKKRLEALMSEAAIKELSKKGLRLDTSKPDCFFTYKLIVNRKYEVNQDKEVVYNPEVFTPAFDNDAKIYTFSSNNRPVTYAGKLNVDTLREGSFVIDMIDTKQGDVIWRSTMQATTPETYQQPSREGVNAIIHEMFKKFPKK
jgi:hypothetical protein